MYCLCTIQLLPYLFCQILLIVLPIYYNKHLISYRQKKSRNKPTCFGRPLRSEGLWGTKILKIESFNFLK